MNTKTDMTRHHLSGADSTASCGPVAPGLLGGLARAVLAGMMLLVAVGIFDALANLPVITGCSFYGDCSLAPMTDSPSELGVRPAE